MISCILFPCHSAYPALKGFFHGALYHSGEKEQDEIEAALRAHMAEYAPDCEVISNSFIHERISYS